MYVCMYVCMYQVNKDCKHPKKECSIYIYTYIYIYIYICIKSIGTVNIQRMSAIYIYIYIYMYVCMHQVNKECKHPKNECSMLGYLIQDIPAEQNIYFGLKCKKIRDYIL